MSDPVKIAILVLVVVAAFAAMWSGWRRRTVRSGAVVPELPAVPPLGQPRVGPLEVTYLATAPADDRLSRVAAHGLAVRANGDVEVHGEGVLVRRVGAVDLFVPATAVAAVTRASGMAGTAVGRDRVVVLRWSHRGVALDTGLLPRHVGDGRRLVEAIEGLAGAPHDTAPTEGRPV